MAAHTSTAAYSSLVWCSWNMEFITYFFRECLRSSKLCLQLSRTHKLWITNQWSYYPGLPQSKQHFHGHSETTGPPLPSIFLSNARSLVNKMDEMNLHLAKNNFMWDCSVMVITETWLHLDIPDTAVQLTGRTTHRQDCSKDSSKTRGGGLCLYMHNAWCSSSRITHSHFSPDIEALSVMCRPFYLPRELTAVIATAVYIPPDANVSSALAHLHCTLNSYRLILTVSTS